MNFIENAQFVLLFAIESKILKLPDNSFLTH